MKAAEALVVAGHGRHVVVEDADGARHVAHLRGKGRKGVAVVGDRVRAAPAGDEVVVDAILERRNLLFRQDEMRTKAFAANLDGLLVVVAAEPAFSESQLARALVAANDAGIPTTIVLNKRDLPAFAAARERLAPYAASGVPIVETGLRQEPDAARAALVPLLAGRLTLALGPSGAGKSTLVNALVPDAAATTGELSAALASGRHTTTTTLLYWIDAARTSALIDSPGFQTFGLAHIAPERLPALMPDIGAYADCRFYNCRHVQEPGCGVRAAVERGDIAPSRHRIYLELLEELGGTAGAAR